uniref:Uncharacterized protein n=1 Tax=Zea mays TaxID=4577 RepID=A0A804LVZ0_MAIZE
MPTRSSRGAAPEEDRCGLPRPAGWARAALGCMVAGARPRPPLRRIRGRGRALARRQSSSLLVATRRPSGPACARRVARPNTTHICAHAVAGEPGNQETSNGSSGHKTLHVKGWADRVERLRQDQHLPSGVLFCLVKLWSVASSIKSTTTKTTQNSVYWSKHA